MPQRQDNAFTSYKFTQEELLAARALTEDQRCYYQTLLSDAMTEKMVLQIDAYKPMEFIQAEAYLRGQVDILNMLLSEAGGITRPKTPPPTPPDVVMRAVPEPPLDLSRT